MPSSTFFRLPEEKRTRLIDAAWEEFTRTKFADVSINRIIHRAHIPRGSFYQYFSDKEDIFFYLVSDVQDYFVDILNHLLTDVKGDLFQVPVRAFDSFFHHGSTDLVVERCIQVLRINPGMDIQHLMSGKPNCLPESVLNHIDMSQLREQDRSFVEQVFAMLFMALGSAIVETLIHPENWGEQREILQTRIDIIQFGSAIKSTAMK